MAPEFERAAAALEPHVRLGKLDTERHGAAAARLSIQSIPTLILFHRGRELGRLSGARPAGQIVAWTQEQLARAGVATVSAA
jgi:thioredoxin 2